MYISNHGTRRKCARCPNWLPQFRTKTGQLCPACVIATTDDPERIEKARHTLAGVAARDRVAELHPARPVDPAEELRRQEQARQRRPAAVQAAPARRAAGNVRDW
jgi:cell pole-organizing protein PopZ